MKPAPKGVVFALCLVGAGLLLYALLGDPSYGYFGLMKFGVLGCSLYVAWALHERNPKLAPLSLALGALGLFEFFGKMHREQWVPWNWAMVAAFGVAGIVSVARR